ncbi:MAG: TetR/AcrR family transcriptional regulator, partial [Streptomycetaceae bacterium]|nr:TetR/AcrR family transcriptional regulator [Streptomycetaceae bacterium]
RRRDGQTIPQWQQAQQEYLTQVVAAGHHPHLATTLAGAAPVTAPEPPEALFTRLTTRVLRGLLADESG